MSVLGKRLKRLLRDREMSQRDLAKHFGWGDTTVSQYVSGTREPDLRTLDELADYFDVTIDYLLGRTSNPTGVSARKIPADWEEIIDSLESEGISPEDIAAAKDLIKTYKRMQTREG